MKVDKPKWAQGILKVREAERQIEDARTAFLAMRCGAEEGGGARCTADQHPEHAHRYHSEDLP